MYQDVVVWLLRHELIVTLHLHIRIVVTPEIKELVRKRREQAARKRLDRQLSSTRPGRDRRRRESDGQGGLERQVINDGFTRSLSRRRRRSSRSNDGPGSATLTEGGIAQSLKQHDVFNTRGRSRLRQVDTEDGDEEQSHSRLRYSAIADDEEFEEEEEEEELSEGARAEQYGDGTEEDDDEKDEGKRDDNHLPSVITDPGKAKPLQQKWIEALSEGKPDEVANRFRK